MHTSSPIRPKKHNNGINTEAKQLVSLKVFEVFTLRAFVKISGMFDLGYADRRCLIRPSSSLFKSTGRGENKNEKDG